MLQALKSREVRRINGSSFFIGIEVKKISPKGESFSQSSLNDYHVVHSHVIGWEVMEIL